MSALNFTKMVGTGNDFVVVDVRKHSDRTLRPRWRSISRKVCDRRYGVGADGLLVLEPSSRADVRMRVFNPDGSEAEMCGNGARCVARYVADKSSKARGARSIEVETQAGVLSACVHAGRVSLGMTDPTDLQLGGFLELDGQRIDYGFVNTGVPHVVVPVSNLGSTDVARLGRLIRNHQRFAPKGTNVNFIEQAKSVRLRVRTYERGVEAETLACGTGLSASAIIFALRYTSKKSSYRIEVEPMSGDLMSVSFNAARGPSVIRLSNVILEGPVHRVFEGTIE